MTAQFHEDQEVEVWCFPDGEWEQAKIVAQYAARTAATTARNPRWHVQFRDGTRAVFDAAHIREIDPDFEHAS